MLGLAFDPAGADGASGAPHAVRVASSALTPSYNPSQRLEVLPALGAVDLGDVIPIGELDRALESLSDAVAAVVREGAVALCLGGHPAVTLAALRAGAARHGPLALVAFDAHLDEGRGIRGAVGQGLVDPARSTLLGPRGGTAGPGAFDELRELGLLVFGWDELAQLGSGAVAAAVDRAAGPAVLAVDLDVADPAFAPAVREAGRRRADVGAGGGVDPRLPGSRPGSRDRRRLRARARRVGHQLAARGDAGVGDHGAGGRAEGRRAVRVACVQLNTREDKAANVKQAVGLAARAAQGGARLVVLPETWTYKGRHRHLEAEAETLDGPSTARLAALAREHAVYVLAGSLYERTATPGRYANTSVLLDPRGEPVAVYRKIHLFDAAVPGAVAYRESDDIEPGSELVTAEVDGVTVGLTVCYDLRFPELYTALAARGARLLLVPVGVHRPHRRRALARAAAGAGGREPVLRGRARSDGSASARPPLLRPQPDRRPVGHGARRRRRGRGRGQRRVGLRQG